MTPTDPDRPPRPRVLVVDDDPNNLVVTAALLDEDCRVDTAANAAEALALADRNPPDLCLTDQRMPGWNGVELLERLRERHPDTVRMIVTAYADVGDILDAINRGEVHRYVLKPWNPPEVRITVRQALEWGWDRRERRRLADVLAGTVADLEARNRDLEEALARAVRAERMAQVGRFAAEASHDLGNLVQVVSGVAESLAAGRVSPVAVEALGETAERLQDLTGVLRDLAGAAGCEMRRRREDVAVLLRTSAELVRQTPAARDVSIRVECPEGLLFGVDRRRVRALLLNLLRNAVEAARREVRAGAAVDESGLRLWVEDDGPGIPESERERVFRPFGSSREGGLGLGLCSSRRIAEEHGGTLDAEAGDAGGARLVLRLPPPVAVPAGCGERTGTGREPVPEAVSG
jgi:signal transduction histidine kinase